ncbi:MAG: T9SS type A sorting domain-containing protein [Pseudoflavonifractor sp.]|nr:T9SS type A sorting domain-containing protein [Pseudoflavonifractor sp.]
MTTTYGTTVTTTALTWKTPESTATSTTSARMSVETNCDAESGAGFEWRRIDAPDLVPSSKAPCAIIDGKLMGSLRNLNPEVYYKFRPYYTSASGKSYYGEWTGLFTGDANVYFEPEVRTVAGAIASERSIKLAGYALAGSDDITEQGFEYRAVGKTDPRSRAAATWIRIPATGIKMETVIDDLDYATTYRYRAYAVTTKGTFYGDEQEFATEGESAIDDIITDTTAPLTVTLRENPAIGTAWLRVSATAATELRYIITSVSGAAVSTGIIPADDDIWQPVELTIPSGLYLLTVTDGTSAKTLRLIVR